MLARIIKIWVTETQSLNLKGIIPNIMLYDNIVHVESLSYKYIPMLPTTHNESIQVGITQTRFLIPFGYCSVVLSGSCSNLMLDFANCNLFNSSEITLCPRQTLQIYQGHIVSHGTPAVCQHCGSTLSREHILLECGGTVQELCGEFYKADSLIPFFEWLPPLVITEYLKEAGFFHLIWSVYENEITNVKSYKPQNTT